MVAFCIARVLPIAFGSTLHCTRSPASRAIPKLKRGRYVPSANNWKFRGPRRGCDHVLLHHCHSERSEESAAARMSFRCEVWIVLQQFSLARALRELAQ